MIRWVATYDNGELRGYRAVRSPHNSDAEVEAARTESLASCDAAMEELAERNPELFEEPA